MHSTPGTRFQRKKGFDMLVLGGGIAGLTAAWRGAKSGLSVALIEQGPLFGGQVATLGEIDDYPSIAHQSGTELASQLVTVARDSGAAISEGTATSIQRAGNAFTVELQDTTLSAKSVVIATGARLRKLDLPDASKLEGRGISQCATCDGAFFRNSDVVVIGGGDGALQSALQLSPSCSSVTIVVRGALRARQAYIDAASNLSNLRFVWDSMVEAIIGDENVAGVRVQNHKTGQSVELACSGVFPLIGVEPNSGFAANLVERNDQGYIVTQSDTETSVPGIYAIGAVRAGFCGALASAAGEGAAVAETIARLYRR
jgi:thioredoxin reductase (NADPH)